MDNSPPDCAKPESVWAPLREPRYRWFWIAIFAAYIGVWMQNVGAGWLMATLTRSPLLIASVQFATSLPVFLLSLPAGVLADQRDRRTLIKLTYVWILVVDLAVSIAAVYGLIGPRGLLVATACLGSGIAIGGPAVQATVADLVPRAQLGRAVNLGGIAFNTARSIGPALAGLLLVSLSPAWVFAASSLSVVGVLIVASRLPKYVRAPHGPPERLISGMRAGLRYALHSPGVLAPLIRTAGFGLCAAAVWALLPLVVARTGAASGGFGLLVGCLGAGAVLSAFLGARVRMIADTVSFWSSLLFAATMFGAALVHWLPALCVMMVLSGVGWALTLNTGYAAMQTMIPAWVRARTLSLYALLLQGSMAAGSLMWGGLAEVTGVPTALELAAAILVTCMLLTRWRFQISTGSDAQMTPVAPWIEFSVAGELDPDDGPVAIEIQYQIDPASRDPFIQASREVGRSRKRDGAMFWRLYRDLEREGGYRERFIVDSWAEYLQTRNRATMGDRILEDRMRAFNIGSGPPQVTHSIAER